MNQDKYSIKGYSLIKNDICSFIIEFNKVIDNSFLSNKYILFKSRVKDNYFDISLLDEEKVMKIMAKEPNVVSLTNEQINKILKIIVSIYNKKIHNINIYKKINTNEKIDKINDYVYIKKIIDEYQPKIINKEKDYEKINVNDEIYIKNKKKLVTLIKGKE